MAERVGVSPLFPFCLAIKTEECQAAKKGGAR